MKIGYFDFLGCLRSNHWKSTFELSKNPFAVNGISDLMCCFACGFRLKREKWKVYVRKYEKAGNPRKIHLYIYWRKNFIHAFYINIFPGLSWV